MNTEIKTFKNLEELGNFLKKNRKLQNIRIEEVSKILLIKKEVLKKFENGRWDINSDSYLKGFLNI